MEQTSGQKHLMPGGQPEMADPKVCIDFELGVACVDWIGLRRRVERTAGRDSRLVLERNQVMIHIDSLLDRRLAQSVALAP